MGKDVTISFNVFLEDSLLIDSIDGYLETINVRLPNECSKEIVQYLEYPVFSFFNDIAKESLTKKEKIEYRNGYFFDLVNNRFIKSIEVYEVKL